MRAGIVTVLFTAALLMPAAASADANPPPGLDCTQNYDAVRAYAAGLPGSTTVTGLPGYDTITVGLQDAWQADFLFTQPGHAAHPAVTLRTRRKQVTGVWTAESKGCGYGDQSQFVALMADMKAEDTRLTNASRADVEKLKQSRSPLEPSP
ncbi:MAG: hypothetical protein IKE66_08130 [Hyphomicrobium sp.]|nr:hypothetical protein [Hyphomicrobium sp.]